MFEIWFFIDVSGYISISILTNMLQTNMEFIQQNSLLHFSWYRCRLVFFFLSNFFSLSTKSCQNEITDGMFKKKYICIYIYIHI